MRSTHQIKEHSPEQQDEAPDFDDHAHHGPADEHDEDAAEEQAGALDLVPLEEEERCPLHADDQRQADDEEKLKEG